MNGYLVARGSSYLQRHGFDGSFTFSAGTASLEYAAVFTREAALALAAHYRRVHGEDVHAWPDLLRPAREPQFGIPDIQHLLRGAA